MDTTQTGPKATTSLTMTVDDLHALIQPVLRFADTKRSFPLLDSVLIRSRGAHVTATATDRYRLAMQRVTPDAAPAPGFRVILRSGDARHLLVTLRAGKGLQPAAVTLTAADGNLTVRTTGSLIDATETTLVYNTVTEEYPQVDTLLTKALGALAGDNPGGADPLFFSPALLVDLKTAAGGHPLVMHPSRPAAGKLVTAGPDFIALVMPVVSAPLPEMASWLPLLDDVR